MSSSQSPRSPDWGLRFRRVSKSWRALPRNPKWNLAAIVLIAVWWISVVMYDSDPMTLGAFLVGAFILGLFAAQKSKTYQRAIPIATTPSGLQDSAAILDLVVQSTADGIWDWDMVQNVVHWSPRVHQLLGLEQGELEQNIDALRHLMHPEDRKHFVQALRNHMVYHEVFDLEVRIKTPHWKEWHDFHICGKAKQAAEGGWERMAGSISNVSEKRAYLRQLEEQAYTDPLTGLGNRNAFFELLKIHQKQSKEAHLPESEYAVILLDLDHFGSVNEAYGYGVGDTLLLSVAKELKLRIASNDHLFRMGGDEFVILCSRLDSQGRVSVLLEKLDLLFESPLKLRHEKFAENLPQNIFVSATRAVILGHQAADQPDELMQMLSLAMFHAKKEGSHTAVYQSEMEGDLKGRKLEQELRQVLWDLRRAMLRDQLYMVFQPIIRLSDHRLAGFESLLRWQKGNDMVQPSLFIPLAEQSDLILSIGEWVLRESCTQFQKWLEQGHDLEFLSVNVAAPQLQRQDVPRMVDKICRETGLQPTYLKLEFTESAAMRDVDRVLGIIQRLNLMGVRISLDDFGTGYSSLGYLRQFNIHTLKIDRSFVVDIVPDDQGEPMDRGAITETIIGMSKNLGLKTIAEGVENTLQLQYLLEHGVDYIQGYYFSRPEKPEVIETLLLKKEWH
jgi:diguanylate cyclase (GGDEF)-like protein